MQNQTFALPPGGHYEEEAVCTAKTKAELILRKDEDIYASLDRLTKRFHSESAQSFEQREEASGWIFSIEMLLNCQRLRPLIKPCASFMHDWMHCMRQGVMNVCQ